MTTIIVLGIIFYFLYKTFGNKKKNNSVDSYNYSKVQVKKDLNLNTKPNSNIRKNDNSIIDITGDSYKINQNNPQAGLKKYMPGVPLWKHQYVYSYAEITSATYVQIEFYNLFKKSFLRGEYLDLEGNNNYAFILLFDLLTEYDKDIPGLSRLLNLLGNYYPKTKPYGESFLAKKKGTSLGIANLEYHNRNEYQNNYTDNDYWKLGSKYKTRLNLKNDEIELLNILWFPSNNFCSIEYCCLEILKLYISTISELKNRYIKEGTNLDNQFLMVADVIARKHFKYRANSNNYKYCIDSTLKEIYSNIFKHCENAVREHYGHKRKINTDTYFTTPEAKAEFEARIISKVVEILPKIVSQINPPDNSTDIELYTQNTNRWKIKYEELTKNYTDNPKLFIENVLLLGSLNKKNPSVENIFFEASKFISKFDKESALILYVHYIHYDMKSATFDNKQLTKTIQKSLFKTNEQLHEFQIVLSEFIKGKNLEKALLGVSNIYAVKRKKINLDTEFIKEVEHQHSGTVELLNEYLKDEYEDENNSIKTQEVNNEDVKIEITQKAEAIRSSSYTNSIPFTQIHEATLEIFSKSNFTVSQIELEAFAKSKGVFKNQLVESINDICYENLDDVLIEEEEEHFTINPNYYQKLLAI
jgi:hypothetical protein